MGITVDRLVPVEMAGDHLRESTQTTQMEARGMALKATMTVADARATTHGGTSGTLAVSHTSRELLTKAMIPNITTIRLDSQTTTNPVARTAGGQVNISQPTLTWMILTTRQDHASQVTSAGRHIHLLTRKHGSPTTAKADTIGTTGHHTTLMASGADRYHSALMLGMHQVMTAGSVNLLIAMRVGGAGRSHPRTQMLKMMQEGGSHPRMKASISTSNRSTRRQGSTTTAKAGTVSLVNHRTTLEVSRADRNRPYILMLEMLLEGGSHLHIIASTSTINHRKRFHHNTRCRTHKPRQPAAHQTNGGSQSQRLGNPRQLRDHPTN